jgi:ABC-type polysaccharide/polyol phosphate export permease
MSDVSVLFNKYYYLTIFVIAKNRLSRMYKDSYLGMLWTLLQPISQILIYAIVMPRIMRFPSEQYVPFLISSLLLWSFINNVIIAGSAALVNNAEIIKRCTVSKTIFPLSELAQYLYNFVISFFIMYAFSTVMYSSFHITILLLPLYMIPVLITLGAVSIALSFITPYLKDFKEIITVGLNFAFWATPIVYPITVFPEEKQFIFFFNPFYILIRPISTLIYSGELPSSMDMLRLFVLMLISIAGSYFIYSKLRRNFIYYL